MPGDDKTIQDEEEQRVIRERRLSDIEQIMRLWLEGNIEAHSFISAEYWMSNIPLVREQLLQAEVYVYEENGIIQGFVGMQENYMAGIFIEKSVRSMGIGKQLLDHIKEIRSSFCLKVNSNRFHCIFRG